MNKKVVIVIIIVAILIVAGVVIAFNFDTIKDWFVKSEEPAEGPEENLAEQSVKEEGILEKELPLLPTGREELLAVDIGKFIVVFDGINFYTYFKEENKWKESSHREFFSEDAVLKYLDFTKLLSLGDKIYTVEPIPKNRSSINRLIEYDPVNDNLKTYPLLIPRVQFTSAVFSGKIHVIGGLSGVPTRSLTDVDVFSPGQDKFVAGISLNSGRHDHWAVGLENYLIVSDGKRQEISGPDIAYEEIFYYFKKDTSEWKPFISASAYPDAVFLPINEHEVIILSGTSSQRKIHHYDFQKSKPTLLKELNLLQVFDPYIGAVIYDDYLYLFGLPSVPIQEQGADLYIVRFGIYNHVVEERSVHLGNNFVFALSNSDKNLIILQDPLDKRHIYLLGGKGFGATKEGKSTHLWETLRKFFLLDLEKF